MMRTFVPIVCVLAACGRKPAQPSPPAGPSSKPDHADYQV